MKKLLYISGIFGIYFFNYGMEQQLQIAPKERFAAKGDLNKQSTKKDIQTYLSQSQIKTKNKISSIQREPSVIELDIENLKKNADLTQMLITANKNNDKIILDKNEVTTTGTNLLQDIIKIAQLSQEINLNNDDKIAIAELTKSPLFSQENINSISQQPNWKTFQEACELLHNIIPNFPVPQTIKDVLATITNKRNQPIFITEGENKYLSEAAKEVINSIIFIAHNLDFSDDQDKKLIAQLKNNPFFQQKDLSKSSLTLYDSNIKESIQNYTQWSDFEKACKTINLSIPDFPVPYILNLQGMKKLQNNIDQDAIALAKLSVEDAYKQLDLYFPENILALKNLRMELEEKIISQEEQRIEFIEEEQEIEKEEAQEKLKEGLIQEKRKKKEIEQIKKQYHQKMQELISKEQEKKVFSPENEQLQEEQPLEENTEELEMLEKVIQSRKENADYIKTLPEESRSPQFNFSIYTPQYFHDQSDKQRLYTDAINYINYIAMNDQLPLKNKWLEIKKRLQEKTLYYLKEAVDHNTPKYEIVKKEQLPEIAPSILQRAAHAISSAISAIYNTIKSWLSWLWS